MISSHGRDSTFTMYLQLGSFKENAKTWNFQYVGRPLLDCLLALYIDLEATLPFFVPVLWVSCPLSRTQAPTNPRWNCVVTFYFSSSLQFRPVGLKYKYFPIHFYNYIFFLPHMHIKYQLLAMKFCNILHFSSQNLPSFSSLSKISHLLALRNV